MKKMNFHKIIQFSENIDKNSLGLGRFPEIGRGMGGGGGRAQKFLISSNSARKSMKIFWSKTFSTQKLTRPNFFEIERSRRLACLPSLFPPHLCTFLSNFVATDVYVLPLREGFKNPSNGQIPLRGYPPLP